ncbi:hypothetical protein [Saccharothrix sp. HUAS TT1]|uniref:hypothetical protein n=1 Tax=unclassified Saccharothrix TaxID=2593673 RepID=UPI00345BEDA4
MTGPRFSAPPERSTVYQAIMHGRFTPVTLPVLEDYDTFTAASEAAGNATRAMMGLTDDVVGFHLVGRDGPDEPLYRSRWRLTGRVSGPALLMHTVDPYDTMIHFRLWRWPPGERKEVVYDELFLNKAYRGDLDPVVPMLLLRQLWAAGRGDIEEDGTRLLTLGSLGTGRFTPTSMEWTDAYDDRNAYTVPYHFEDDAQGRLLGGYGYVYGVNIAYRPALWLVTQGVPAYSRKVSYLVADRADHATWSKRWDDVDEPVPPFTPLDWPQNPDPGPAGRSAAVDVGLVDAVEEPGPARWRFPTAERIAAGDTRVLPADGR